MFQIYFELMRERNSDFLFASIVISINFIQIYGLLYNHKIDFPFNDELYDVICQLCNISRIYPLLEDEKSNNTVYYWIMAFGLIFIVVVYYASLIFIDYSIRIGKFYFRFPI